MTETANLADGSTGSTSPARPVKALRLVRVPMVALPSLRRWTADRHPGGRSRRRAASDKLAYPNYHRLRRSP